MTTMTKTQARTLFVKAVAAGEAAVKACTPVPMYVGTPTTPLGNDIDYSKTVYKVNDGVCGFGYVIVKPARGAFVALLKEKGIGWKHYYGGWAVSAREFAPSIASSQSYEKAMAAARAAAGVLLEAGVGCYPEGRLD